MKKSKKASKCVTQGKLFETEWKIINKMVKYLIRSMLSGEIGSDWTRL